MKGSEMIKRLKSIEDAINAKGHPMQDASTIKLAVLDLVEIVRNLIPNDKCASVTKKGPKKKLR